MATEILLHLRKRAATSWTNSDKVLRVSWIDRFDLVDKEDVRMPQVGNVRQNHSLKYDNSYWKGYFSLTMFLEFVGQLVGWWSVGLMVCLS